MLNSDSESSPDFTLHFDEWDDRMLTATMITKRQAIIATQEVRNNYNAWLKYMADIPDWMINPELMFEHTPSHREERPMPKNYKVNYIDSKVMGIKVAYEPKGKLTTYKTTLKTIKVGDMVVVPTNTRWNMTVCKVMETDIQIDSNSTVQSIISVV